MPTLDKDKGITDAVEYFVKEERIKKRGNVQLSEALEILERVSKSRGLSADDINALCEVAASGRHGDDISCKLIRCLIPTKEFPDRAVMVAISYICTNIPSSKIQAMLLRLLIAVYDYIDKKETIQKLGYLLFCFIENSILTPYICYLLYLLTRKEDVRLFRVRKLLDLQTKLGPQPYLIGLLSIYKLYFPNLVSIVIPSTKKHFFPTRDRQWCSIIREVQEGNQNVETSHMKLSLELSEKLRAAETTMLQGIPPAKRRKVDPIPVVHSSSSNLTVKMSSRLIAMLEEKPVPFVQIPDIETLLRNPDKVELPSQIGAALRSPLLQCFMSYSADPLMTCRFSYWLQDTLCDELLDSTVTSSCFPRIESILEKLIQFTEFIQEGIPAVDQILFRYLQVWNGMDFRQQVFRLITRCRLYPFSLLNEYVLEPLRKLYIRTSVFIKCQITMCLTQLLRNYVVVEIHRYNQKYPQSKPSVSIFEDDVGTFDPLSTIQGLIQFVDRLNCAGLTLENNHILLLHFTLTFSEMVSTLYTRYEVPCVYLPSRHIISAFLTDNAMGPARLCGIVNRYKVNCQKLKNDMKSNEKEAARHQMKETVHSLNILIMDLCDTLWRRKAFTHGRSDSYFHFESGILDVGSNDGLSLYLHQAFLPFSLLFLKETQPKEHIGHPRGIQEIRDTFMEFLQRENINEVKEFIMSTITRYRLSSSTVI
ncbi:centromere protein I-like [Saccostrea echinata]|uniref:centromere protein I-like n=1 Tax=Saccostrea echinata TaxID=191078 RepID=UPI002A82445B|nr:centromere protein I-like [Saccostrea echinata]